MTVKELCDLLEPQDNGDLPVVVRCTWHGETPAHDQFDIKTIIITLERDTGDDLVMIEAVQEP